MAFSTASGSNASLATTRVPSQLKWGTNTDDFVNAAAFAVLILFTAVGNLLILISVVKSRRLRHGTHFYIVNLSLANLLMAAAVMSLRVTSFVGKETWIEKTLCEQYAMFFVLSCSLTVFTLAAMGFDRYLSTSSHRWYQRQLTGWRILVVVAFCWIVALLVSIAPADFRESDVVSLDCKLNRAYGVPFVYAFVIAAVLTPVAFILLLHFKVLKSTVGRMKTVDIQGRKLKNPCDSNEPTFAQETAWSRIVMRITLSFIIFWIPRCIFLLVDNSQEEGIHEVADGLTEILTYCFPASLALLLGYWSSEFKEEFMAIVCPFYCYQRRRDERKYRLGMPNRVKPRAGRMYEEGSV